VSRLENKIPPPLLWVIASALTWIVARLDLDGSPLQSTFAEWAGVLLAILGIGIAFAGLREFSKANTTVDPHRIEEASTVVRTGIYRLTRNPMYVGLTLLSIGWAFRLGTVVGMVVGTGFLLTVLTYLQIKPEERALTKAFGSDYTDYQASVRRWI
jgi:protein-S-isoprenylcysteine O-methyltransferase Ste14